MAIIVLICRLALGGFFTLLGLELAYGVLPSEQIPVLFQDLLAVLKDPATGPLMGGVPEFIAGIMIFSGAWLPLGLLLLVPVLLHVGLNQWLIAPDSMLILCALVALEVFLLWAHAPALKGVLSPMSRSRWGKVQTSKG
jgi:hypothetical protein